MFIELEMINVEFIYICIYWYYILVSYYLIYDELKFLFDRRNVCKYYKYIRLYIIKIFFKIILFIKIYGFKGKGGGRFRG